MFKSFVAALALLVTFCMASPVFAQDADACYSVEQNTKDAKDAGFQIARLSDIDAQIVLADYTKETGTAVDATDVYLAAKPLEGDEVAMILVFFKDGCTVGMTRVNPDHIQQLLSTKS